MSYFLSARLCFLVRNLPQSVHIRTAHCEIIYNIVLWIEGVFNARMLPKCERTQQQTKKKYEQKYVDL
jgi:hypothetical protein